MALPRYLSSGRSHSRRLGCLLHRTKLDDTNVLGYIRQIVGMISRRGNGTVGGTMEADDILREGDLCQGQPSLFGLGEGTYIVVAWHIGQHRCCYVQGNCEDHQGGSS